jgi:hypothetical protein
MVKQEAEEAAAGRLRYLFLSSSNSVSLFPELLVVLSVSCSQWLLQLSALLLQLCKPISLRCQPFLQSTVHRQSCSSLRALLVLRCHLPLMPAVLLQQMQTPLLLVTCEESTIFDVSCRCECPACC